jgi:hypothetical protein
MRIILWGVALLAALWCAYWFAGSWAIDRGLRDGIARANAQGLVVQAETQVSGFPNRFDITLTNPDVGDPVRGIRWTTPFAQVFAMTWKPWHVIAVVAGTQTLDLPGQSVGITTDDLRASVVSAPSSALPLERIALTATAANATSTQGWTVGADVIELHTRRDPTQANLHEFAVDARNVAPDPGLIGSTGLPAVIPVVRLHGAVGFSAPLDRFARDTQPRPISVTITDGALEWGPLGVTAHGQIAPNAEGLAEGRIDIAITGWQQAVPLAVASGALSEDSARMVTNLLAALARQGGDENVLNLPLVYQNGVGMLGPLPLGAAPRLN